MSAWKIAAVAIAAALTSPAGTAAAGAVVPAGSDGRPSVACSSVVSGRAVAVEIARGGRFLCSDITVRGDVDLTRAARVADVFACTGCTFTGALVAKRVVFERGLDLSGATFAGGVLLRGARFAEPALFSSPGSGDDCRDLALTPPGSSSFPGRVDLSSATFDDLAVFDGARFRSKADFTSTRFRGVARFSRACFTRVDFPAASFGRESVFTHASFAGEAHFAGAAFAKPVDFRQSTFGGSESFDEATFDADADFSQASILGTTRFRDARFAGDASFRQVALGQKDEGGLLAAANLASQSARLSFDHAALAGKLDLSGAQLYGEVNLGSVSASSISLENVQLGGDSVLFMDDLTAGALAVRPAALQTYLNAEPAQELTALRLVETTAKDDGNLGRANDAHFRYQVLDSTGEPPYWRVVDIALYRVVAGYFVKPLRPIFWLFVAVGIAALLRAIRLRIRGGNGRLARALIAFGQALAYTVTPGAESHAEGGKDPVLRRRLELSLYAALLGCFAISLANTNPTLRQMVDAVT